MILTKYLFKKKKTKIYKCLKNVFQMRSTNMHATKIIDLWSTIKKINNFTYDSKDCFEKHIESIMDHASKPINIFK